jgi:hypothetical protein
VHPRAGEGDEGFEGGFGFFVARGESAKALEFAEATLDTVALFIDVFVVLALYLAVSFGCSADSTNRSELSRTEARLDLRGSASSLSANSPEAR